MSFAQFESGFNFDNVIIEEKIIFDERVHQIFLTIDKFNQLLFTIEEDVVSISWSSNGYFYNNYSDFLVFIRLMESFLEKEFDFFTYTIGERSGEIHNGKRWNLAKELRTMNMSWYAPDGDIIDSVGVCFENPDFKKLQEFLYDLLNPRKCLYIYRFSDN